MSTHTVMSVLRAAEGWLDARGIDAPRRSAELLLGKVLGKDRLQLYLDHDRPLDERERTAMRELVARRGKHEPVAHLLGEWSFRGLPLEVSAAVLIPRPETEELVDQVLPLLGERARVVDLGTGSGALAIALAKERPDIEVTATDISKNALAVAQRNVERHGLQARVRLRHGSWWEACAEQSPFDLVVSNPPYVDPGAVASLAADVRTFEPPLALFTDRGDPGSCYRQIAAGLGAHLRPGGAVVLETGVGAEAAACAALRTVSGMRTVELRQDAGGRDRFVVAVRN